jgi:MtfA peptidase
VDAAQAAGDKLPPMFGLLKRRRRERLRGAAVPTAWHEILRANCGFYGRIPAADQAELLGHMQVFLAEKHLEGCQGLEITDEIRVTVAANACLLLLHRRTDYFPHLVTILIYPSAFVVEHTEVDELGIEWRERLTNLGESWERGNVVLAWDNARHGAMDPYDGLNVILHEFAHQLDAEDGAAEGAPPLPRHLREQWAKVFRAEFEALNAALDAEEDTFLDPYGAEDPAEFFAVCVETFFELPRELRAEHPELYRLLSACFAQDPASWRWD